MLAEKQRQMLQLEQKAKTQQNQFRVQASDLKRTRSLLDALRRKNLELRKGFRTDSLSKRLLGSQKVHMIRSLSLL
jgi:hypothetical protein